MLTLTLKQQLASNSHYYALRCTSANVVSVVFQVIYGKEITYTFSWLKWPTEIDDFEYRHWRKQVAQDFGAIYGKDVTFHDYAVA